MDTTVAQQMLVEAEHLCLRRNVRLTPQRQKVLEIMINRQGAISAYDLLDLLRLSEPQAKPPTVYRALDFLLTQGFIHKVESNNSYVLCHHFNQPVHTSAMFICDRCGNVTEKPAKSVESIMHSLADNIDFDLRHSVIEAHGLCVSCQQVANCRNPQSCQHDHSLDNKKRGRQ